MKLTLWQQFSSNHSAYFFVVGKFETAEKAEQVAEELRQIIRKVYTWWQQLDDDTANKWWRRIHRGEITPIEAKLARQYDVTWSTKLYGRESGQGPLHGIDYLDPMDEDLDEVVQQYVSQFENRVMIQSNGDTEVNSAPFTPLMKKYGGTVSGSEGYQGAEFDLVIVAVAPDETTADALMADIVHKLPEPDTWGTEMFYVNGQEMWDRPVRECNQITYRINAFLDDTPWYYVVTMREYLTAHGCTMDYHFEGEGNFE